MSKTGNTARLRFAAATSTFVALSALSFASAQEDTDDASVQDVIVVTAERRAVSVQDMPVSVIALSGDMLKERGVATLDDLQKEVPSLNFTDAGNVKYINIRGVGLSEGAPNQTTGVAVHLDGAYVAREFVYGDAFFDLQAVEVLRGPQGTYLGQNASGGAIFINSKAPDFEGTSGFADFEYGSYNHYRGGAGVNYALNDVLAVRVSGEFESKDSFYENHGPIASTSPSNIDNQPGNRNRHLGRFQVLYQPTDDFSLRVIHQTSVNETDGVARNRYPVAGSTQLPATGLFDLHYDFAGHINVDYERSTAVADWQTGAGFAVKGIVSHQSSNQHFLADTDYTSPFDANPIVQGVNDFMISDTYTTAEVDLISTLEGPLEWTVGATMLDYDQSNVLNFGEYNSTRRPETSYNPTTSARLFLNLNSVRQNEAVFAEVGYRILPQLQIKAGARYNHDKVGFDKGSYIGFSYNAGSGPALTPPLLDFNETTGRVLINWTPNDNNLLYATYSKGYKPGGTNPFGAAYDSEFVTNTEIGWKGNLFDDHLRTSVSLFDMAYDNFQRTYSDDPASANPATATTKNVKDTSIKGIEAQLSGDFGQFGWDLAFAWNDGKYGDLVVALPAGATDGVNPTVATLINISGSQVDFLPESSINGGVSYAFPLLNGELKPSLRFSHQASYSTSFFKTPYSVVPERTLVDLSVAYKDEADWRLEGYVRNLMDETYISASSGGTTPPGFYTLGAPREYGVRLNLQF